MPPRGIKRDVLGNAAFGALRLVFLGDDLLLRPQRIYFLTDLVHVWFALLLVMMDYPRPHKPLLACAQWPGPLCFQLNKRKAERQWLAAGLLVAERKSAGCKDISP